MTLTVRKAYTLNELSNNDWRDICWRLNGGKLWAVGINNAYISQSIDGTSWSRVSNYAHWRYAICGQVKACWGIDFADNKIYKNGNSSSGSGMSLQGTLPFGATTNNDTHKTNSIAISTANNRLWVLKAISNQAAYSDNGGVSWNSVTLPVLTWSRFCYSRYFGKFFYKTQYGTNNAGGKSLLYEARSTSNNFTLKKEIVGGSGGFEGPMVCAGPYIISCDDWATIAKYDYHEDYDYGFVIKPALQKSYTGMTFGDGRIYIIRIDGQIYSFHPDLLDWKEHPSSSSGYTIEVIGNSSRSKAISASYVGNNNKGEDTFVVNTSDWKRFNNTGAYYVDIKTKFVNLIKADISYQKPVVSGGKFTLNKKGTVIITVDGTKNLEWKKVATNNDACFMLAKYVNGNFFVTNHKGQLYVSPDGVNWSASTPVSGYSGYLYDIAFGRGVYVLSQNGYILRSTNLSSWNQITDTTGISSWTGNIVYGFGNFIRTGRTLVSGEFGAAYSSDGIHWYKSRFDFSGDFYKTDLKYINNEFLVTGIGGYYCTSDDGMLFASRSSVGNLLSCIEYMQNCKKYVISDDSGNIYSSTSPYNICSSSCKNLNNSARIFGLAYGKGLCIATDTNGKAFKSTDGVNWSEISSIPASYHNNFNHLGYSRALNKFCSASNGGIYTLDWDGNTAAGSISFSGTSGSVNSESGITGKRVFTFRSSQISGTTISFTQANLKILSAKMTT